LNEVLVVCGAVVVSLTSSAETLLSKMK